MIGQKSRRTNASPARKRHSSARAWLGTEIELIIRERERLLQTAAAAAALFSSLNIRNIPREAREPVRRLAAILESLPEETLTDAIESSLGENRQARARASH